ncbi:MAG: hypothetical protein IH600_06915 [Bacteroidetes bacterium]|nr:hypothetical protein [Bacteroidota bacterium]
MKRSVHIVFLALALPLCMASGRAQTRADTPTHGNLGPHIAVGSVNGVRLGLRYFPIPTLALEAAGGYLQITLLRENERKEYTDGYSATIGGSWYTHPDALISPMLSLLATYIAGTTLPDGYAQNRVAIVPSLGSEYFFLDGFSIFFRFGPAFQFVSEPGDSHFETTTQFDGGVSLLF